MFAKLKKLAERSRDRLETLSVDELDCVSGAGEESKLDQCVVKCSNDPNVSTNAQLSICVDKCLQS